MSIIGAILGVSEVTGTIISTAAKLTIGARQVDDGTAQRMVDKMRGLVPQNSGRLLNGITAELTGDVWTVKASAINPAGRNQGASEGADYASFQEYGTVHIEAQPFFWGPAREELAGREQAMQAMVNDLAA
jgi:hypothetical protein